jgi:hypothetical protein
VNAAEYDAFYEAGRKYFPMFGDPVGPWIPATAWLPRWTCDGGWVWLRPVWRRLIQKHYYLPIGFYPPYIRCPESEAGAALII